MIKKQKIVFDNVSFPRENGQSQTVNSLVEDFAIDFVYKCKIEANRLIKELEAGYVTQDFILVA